MDLDMLVPISNRLHTSEDLHVRIVASLRQSNREIAQEQPGRR